MAVEPGLPDRAAPADPRAWHNPYPGYMAFPSALLDIQAGYVLAAITLLALPIAAVSFARSGEAWRSIGRGPTAIEERLPAGATRDEVVREEVRQMLTARNERLTRRGEEPLDVEAETERQLAGL